MNISRFMLKLQLIIFNQVK